MRKKKQALEKDNELLELVVKGMQEKKAEDIAVLDLKGLKNAVTDYFIICSSTSSSHADAISDSIEEEVKKHSGATPWHREGKGNKEWILIDYVDIVAHVFRKDKRGFFALEELWGDADIKLIK